MGSSFSPLQAMILSLYHKAVFTQCNFTYFIIVKFYYIVEFYYAAKGDIVKCYDIVEFYYIKSEYLVKFYDVLKSNTALMTFFFKTSK